jgi:hypothetical protein
MSNRRDEKPILCPSGQADSPEAQVFGVQMNTPAGEMRVAYLTEPQPITPDLAAVIGTAKPSEVMRIATPCAGGGCVHFDGQNCGIAARVAALLDPVVRSLPRCAIRPTCRWFRQEGPAACVRCPQVITDARAPTELQRQIAGPGAELATVDAPQPAR